MWCDNNQKKKEKKKSILRDLGVKWQRDFEKLFEFTESQVTTF